MVVGEGLTGEGGRVRATPKQGQVPGWLIELSLRVGEDDGVGISSEQFGLHRMKSGLYYYMIYFLHRGVGQVKDLPAHNWRHHQPDSCSTHHCH